jgi:MtN3 and saliva related transmembrane protein
MVAPELIGTIAASCTTFALLPQIFKAMRTHEMHDVSLGTLLLVLIGVTLWAFYGILRKDTVLILANTAQGGLAIVALWMKRKYGWNYGRKH